MTRALPILLLLAGCYPDFDRALDGGSKRDGSISSGGDGSTSQGGDGSTSQGSDGGSEKITCPASSDSFDPCSAAHALYAVLSGGNVQITRDPGPGTSCGVHSIPIAATPTAITEVGDSIYVIIGGHLVKYAQSGSITCDPVTVPTGSHPVDLFYSDQVLGISWADSTNTLTSITIDGTNYRNDALTGKTHATYEPEGEPPQVVLIGPTSEAEIDLSGESSPPPPLTQVSGESLMQIASLGDTFSIGGTVNGTPSAFIVEEGTVTALPSIPLDSSCVLRGVWPSPFDNIHYFVLCGTTIMLLNSNDSSVAAWTYTGATDVIGVVPMQ